MEEAKAWEDKEKMWGESKLFCDNKVIAEKQRIHFFVHE